MSYRELERDAERPPKKVRDWTPTWERLEPLAAINGPIRASLDAFCDRKRITFAALEALEARYAAMNGHVCLAFAGRNGNGVVTAIKYRPVDGSSRDSFSEHSSVWLRPIVIGKRDSLDWLVAEGESDGARLWELAGDVAAIMVLPAGAYTFKREWADLIPRGATVVLCHDADEHGDPGAEKAAKIVGGRTVRVRPPVEGGDWCDWPGGRDEFLALVAAARADVRRYEFASSADFQARRYPQPDALLGEPGQIYLAIGTLLLVYGADGSAKSTWTVDGIAHLAAGLAWLGIPVPRPVRFCVIENEGPPALFQQKLAEKAATWDGHDWTGNVFVYSEPWGEFSFADPDARAALTDFCDEHAVDVVVANPTLGLGVAGSGRPDETQQFVDWLVECGLKSRRAFWLLHHENKAGQISGDWGRHPDTKVQLQADGKQPRTKLVWEKTRWATLPSDTQAKACMLDWVVETKSYTVVELPADGGGASDAELEERIADYLDEHPMPTTNDVTRDVKGTDARISKLLKTSDRFDCIPGSRGASLWFERDHAPDRGDTSAAEPPQ